MACATFDLQRQREELEKLRREVEALDGSAYSACERSSSSATKADGESPALDTAYPAISRKADAAASRIDEHLEASIADLLSQVECLSSESESMRSELSRREAIQAQAKAEWSRTLSHASASESRDERRLAMAKRESEELRQEGFQQQAVHRLDRDRLRQRHRNLRMQFKQAERQYFETEQQEAMGCEFNGTEDQREAAYFRSMDMHASPTSSSTASPHGAPQTRSRPRSYSPGRLPVGIKASAAYQQMESARSSIRQLECRQEGLLQGQRELASREADLRRASRISNREVEHISRRSRMRAEEAELRETQDALRSEVAEVGSEAGAAQREAAKHRSVQERLGHELSDREAYYQTEQASALEALGTIDEYLAADTSGLCGDQRQEHLAEWLEADISTRQVERVKRRLGELVADAGARAQVLEQAVGEMHADLDRRAAIILELVERRSAIPLASETSLGEAGYASSSDDDDAQVVSGSRPPSSSRRKDEGEATEQADTQDRQSSRSENQGKKSEDTAVAKKNELERRALEEELEHQRGLFELRSEQVQGLEQRLAALLAREAPRVYALRAWVAVHEALSRDKLQACLVAAASSTALRTDVETMHRAKSVRLAKVEAEWHEERYRLSEAANEARQSADKAASLAAAVLTRRQGLLRRLDQTLKAETKLAARVTSACDAVDRDQRRLVDLTARQIRASFCHSKKESDPVNRVMRGETARQALEDARELVEATREQQAEALLGLVHESFQVGKELKNIDMAIERELVQEERAMLQMSEAEMQAVGRAERDRQASPRRSSSNSPRRKQQGACAASAPPSAPPAAPAAKKSLATQRQLLAKKSSRLEEDLRVTAEQLRRSDSKLEEAEMAQVGINEHAEARLAQTQQEFDAERAKQNATVAGVLKRHRAAQASYAEMESVHGELMARTSALNKELEDARSALQRGRDKRQKSQERRRPQGSSAIPAESGVADNRATSSSCSQIGCRPKSPAHLSRGLMTPRAASSLSRNIPSILEIQQRVDVEANPELHSFYLQVLPLLKGSNIDLFRRSSQRFETRRMWLSSDLQRLEFWTPSTPSTSSTAKVSPTSARAATPNSRNRIRLAECFLRIEWLARVHIPKQTHVAVQRAILNATSGAVPDGMQRHTDCNSSPVCPSTDSQHEGLGPGRPSPQHAGATSKSSTTNRGNRQSFSFDLITSCSETWRFMVNDVQTFHIATNGISALLTSRHSLPAYAVALGLGALPQPT